MKIRSMVYEFHARTTEPKVESVENDVIPSWKYQYPASPVSAAKFTKTNAPYSSPSDAVLAQGTDLNQCLLDVLPARETQHQDVVQRGHHHLADHTDPTGKPGHRR